MKIVRYGIRLEKLNTKTAELVRQWRNDAKIKQHMFYTADISEEQQQQWFNSIDNADNFYFVIYTDNRPIGLINISDINWRSGTAQTGLFIYDDKYIGSDIPVRASLAMLDVFFLLLDLKKVHAKVKGDNRAAHAYNTSLGFTQTDKVEEGKGYLYELSKAAYMQQAQKLREAVMKLHGKHTVITLQTDTKAGKLIQEKLHWAERHTDIDLQVVISN